LKKRVKFFIENPEIQEVATPERLKFLVEGTDIDATKKMGVCLPDPVLAKNGSVIFPEFSIGFDVQNSTDRPIATFYMQFGLEFSKERFEPISRHDSFVNLPNGSYMYIMRPPHEILPYGWEHSTMQLCNRNPVKVRGTGFPCAVKAFSRFGIREISFFINVSLEPG
jgi:hypothetical protein